MLSGRVRFEGGKLKQYSGSLIEAVVSGVRNITAPCEFLRDLKLMRDGVKFARACFDGVC